MPKLSRFLWLLAPLTLVITAWCVVARLTGPAAEGATNANADFLLVAGSLLVATVISYVGLSHLNKAHVTRSTTDRRRVNLLRVVQSLPVSPREWIHAVEFRSKVILIGSCDGKMTRLDDPSDSDPESFAKDPEFSEEGVDLRDTPRPMDEASDERRNLAAARQSRSVSRSALNAANVAGFKSKLEQARESARS